MDDPDKDPIVEAETIQHVLDGIVDNSRNLEEVVCREDMVSLLYIAKMRLDASGSAD